MNPGSESRERLVSIDLDDTSFGRTNPDIEHEREMAIFDLLQSNSFRPQLPARVADRHQDPGPYRLVLGIREGQLGFDIRTNSNEPLVVHFLSLRPFRYLFRDYMTICQNYYGAIKSSSPNQIEAMDMARRSLHNEAAEMLISRLERKIATDFDTSRRLFLLMSVLQWRGTL